MRITKAETDAINAELDDLPAFLRSEVQGMMLAQLLRAKFLKRILLIQIFQLVLIAYCVVMLIDCLSRHSFAFAVANGLLAAANVLMFFYAQKMKRRI